MLRLTLLLITVVAFDCIGAAPRTEKILTNATTPADDIHITYEKGSNGSTFLHLVIRDDPEVLKQLLKLLIQKSVDNVGAINKRKDSPLHKAARNGYYFELAELLIANGADIEAKKFIAQGPLLEAAYRGETELVKQLIANGADVNGTDLNRIWTALKGATSGGQKEMVQLLIDYGADVNYSEFCGFTALSTAVRRGHFDIAQLLIANGADAFAKGCDEWRFLKTSSDETNEKFTQLLRDNLSAKHELTKCREKFKHLPSNQWWF